MQTPCQKGNAGYAVEQFPSFLDVQKAFEGIEELVPRTSPVVVRNCIRHAKRPIL